MDFLELDPEVDLDPGKIEASRPVFSVAVKLVR